MQKVLLYYKFVPVVDSKAVQLWQQTLCEMLNLKGRIIIADHGLNGTVGGDIVDLKRYIRNTRSHQAFKDMTFKWSDGAREDFPKLSVRVRPEIVTFGVPDKIKVNGTGIVGGGKRLKPEELHELIKKQGKNSVVFFDGRNAREAAIGRFQGAVITDAEHTRDFPREIKKSKYARIKNKTVVTYCTGGIRCEVLSMLMKQEGFRDVYQLDGGIIKYGEVYGNEGLWQGNLYVFDKRVSLPIGKTAPAIGTCSYCQAPANTYGDCMNSDCNRLFIACQVCADRDYCPDCRDITAVHTS
jgi:UPF0176 protein